MDFEFWKDRWEAGRIGFHDDGPNSLLQKHVAALGPAQGRRVLVPLCGKSHDLTFLADAGFEVFGIEFVDDAARAYFVERALTPDEIQMGGHRGYQKGPVTILVADYFSLQPDEVGLCDALYDRAALVAIEPARRESYMKQSAALLCAGAPVLLINFEHDMGAGPPHSVPSDTLVALSEPYMRLRKESEADILQPDSRFRERGATHMLEQLWVGKKL